MIKPLTIYLFLGLSFAHFFAQGSQATIALKVGVPAFPPFAYLDENNQLSGAMVDYFDLLEQDTGYRFDIILEPYSRVIADVKQGKLDLAVIFRNAQLEGYADFIGPVSKSKVIVLPQAEKNLVDYDQLLLLDHIGVVRGASFAKRFDEDALLKKLSISDYAQGLNLLHLNRVDAVVGSLEGLEYNILASGKALEDYGQPLLLTEKEYWLHFSNLSSYRHIVPRLKQAIDKLYQADLIYQLYRSADSSKIKTDDGQ